MEMAFLDDRGIVEVEGPDARALLHRLVTSDVASLGRGEARYAALLSPQGKIAVDFLVLDDTPEGGPDRFLLDVPVALAPDLARKLTMYRLRADVRIADRSADLGVAAHWRDGPGFRDPRHPDLGTRAIGPRAESGAEARLRYDAHRIALGVPDGGRDFAYGDAFPHDANLDRLGGVDFGKGCYVGQAVGDVVEVDVARRGREEVEAAAGQHALPRRAGADRVERFAGDLRGPGHDSARERWTPSAIAGAPSAAASAARSTRTVARPRVPTLDPIVPMAIPPTAISDPSAGARPRNRTASIRLRAVPR